MSAKIKHIIAVLTEIQKMYNIGTNMSIKKLRNEATAKIANKFGLRRTTVIDKYQRGLAPDINNVSEFDTLVMEWLQSSSGRLQSILLKHADDHDQLVIEEFFGHKGYNELVMTDSVQVAKELPTSEQRYSEITKEPDIMSVSDHITHLFDELLSKITMEIDQVSHDGSNAFLNRDYASVVALGKLGTDLERILTNIREAQEDWFRIHSDRLT